MKKTGCKGSAAAETEKVESRPNKMLKKPHEITDIRNSLALASAILIFHVALLAGIGILVLFFSGIVNYIFWIFIAGSALITGAAYLFYRRMKKEGGAAFLKILSLPELRGKNIEVHFLGGLASLKIAGDRDHQVIENMAMPVSRQLEDPDSRRFRELMELARLMEKNLITPDEYHQVKKSLLN
ncbi:MAG: hypothetical protein COX19_02420 [Desulfobacterales bacterium CG23_combo_of_CG06-09_8_20_14_all_51_8]|nr:MAG: hypothetical protein COX19_02420 [Desulfobacterales bacterium CG23_combo_of_CG06-09_8_20_14_all_51_8]